MILADASIWIGHFRNPDETLLRLMDEDDVVCHDFVIGEISLGHIRNRDVVLGELSELQKTKVALNEEVLELILRHGLFGKGIGYVDAHLLASAILTEGCLLWTRDKNLSNVAHRLCVEAKFR